MFIIWLWISEALYYCFLTVGSIYFLDWKAVVSSKVTIVFSNSMSHKKGRTLVPEAPAKRGVGEERMYAALPWNFQEAVSVTRTLDTQIAQRGTNQLRQGPSSIACLIPNKNNLCLSLVGSLAKLVYFTKDDDHFVDGEGGISSRKALEKSKGNRNHPVLKGRLNFKKFETSKINDCLDFIKTMKLHLGGSQQQENPGSQPIAIKATGGGAYKYADLFKERLRIILDKEDEMDCLVAGANFLLEVVHQEAFTYIGDQKQFVKIDQNDLYPYLLVNIGSGVGMIKVEGDGKFERVSGTSIGGGTFWGLGKLLTKCKSFDELLELSYQGNNRAVDMLVGDIYGGMDYSKIGLSSTAIASSFGKAISDNKEREDFKPEDIARSLLRMISNNIGQISYLNALRFGLKRIFFGGFFIRRHPFTMDTLSVAVNFWSKGEAKAMFLRHEGFLGAVGAFMSSDKHGLKELLVNQVAQQTPTKLSFAVDKIHGPLDGELNGDESIECSVYAA